MNDVPRKPQRENVAHGPNTATQRARDMPVVAPTSMANGADYSAGHAMSLL